MFMNFTNILSLWEKGELLQGKIMVGVGVLLLIAFIGIIRSQNELLRGMLIPLGLTLAVLIGYGGYILQSRPAHIQQSIASYQTSPSDAVEKEIAKHTKDNQAGKTLMKIYPVLAILAILALMFIPSLFYKGLALGFALLFLSVYIIDNGFVTRSDRVIQAISVTP